MIKFTFRKPDYGRVGRRLEADLRRKITQQLIQGLQEFQDAIMQTPVYTGRTLVNYRWSIGAPISGVRSPVKDPDLPGTTSEMRIGTEPRRRANAVPVIEEFKNLIGTLRRTQNPYVDLYLVNNVPYFSDVEYGTYSTSEGSTTRTPPGGMVRRGETMLVASLPALRKK